MNRPEQRGNKDQALHSFWSGFGLPAYDESTVPSGKEGEAPAMPYITYEVAKDNIDNAVFLTASLWYRSTSWVEISQKADEIANYIGHGVVFKITGGYVYISRGTPFAQRMADEQEAVRRIVLNISVEYITEF